MKALTDWVLGPVWQGILIAGLCYTVPYLDMLAVVIQLLVTMRQGMQKGLIVTLGSIIIGITTSFVLSSLVTEVETKLFYESMQWALTLSLPLWALAGFLRATVSFKLTMQLMTIGFIGLYLLMYNSDFHVFPESMQIVMSQSVDTLTSSITKVQEQYNNEVNIVDNLSDFKIFLTKLLEVVSVYTMYMIVLILARLWQSYIFVPKGFSEEFTNLRCGTVLAIIFTIAWVLELFLPEAMTKLTFSLAGVVFISAIWLIMSGLAFFHWVVNLFDMNKGHIALFYFLLLMPFVSSLLLILLATIGLLDGFKNLRALVIKFKNN